jgi:hypothetical protein
VDELIGGLKGNGCYTMGYADDLLSSTAKNSGTPRVSTGGYEYCTTVV